MRAAMGMRCQGARLTDFLRGSDLQVDVHPVVADDETTGGVGGSVEVHVVCAPGLRGRERWLCNGRW